MGRSRHRSVRAGSPTHATVPRRARAWRRGRRRRTLLPASARRGKGSPASANTNRPVNAAASAPREPENAIEASTPGEDGCGDRRQTRVRAKTVKYAASGVATARAPSSRGSARRRALDSARARRWSRPGPHARSGRRARAARRSRPRLPRRRCRPRLPREASADLPSHARGVPRRRLLRRIRPREQPSSAASRTRRPTGAQARRELRRRVNSRSGAFSRKRHAQSAARASSAASTPQRTFAAGPHPRQDRAAREDGRDHEGCECDLDRALQPGDREGIGERGARIPSVRECS